MQPHGTPEFRLVGVQGIITKHPTGTEDYSIRGKFKVPVNFHIGSMGLALATNVTVDSVPPTLGGKCPKASSWLFLLCSLVNLWSTDRSDRGRAHEAALMVIQP